MPKTETATVTRLRDYRPPAYCIVETVLDIALDFDETRIRARHQVRRQAATDATADLADLVLDADADMLALHAVRIDGVALPPQRYRMENNKLIITDVPAATEFELAIDNSAFPSRNTALSGLYQSGDMLCTQCEAEGFRRITPAVDRPDNLAVYHVTLRADAAKFPQLLCNGNLVDRGDDGDDDGDDGDSKANNRRHFATWHDPFPKPTYLFAIVAGALARLDGRFTTCSGRTVDLRFFARARDIDKCAHALESLKRAMAWDETTYGREYDLDLFNVVAVGDFNMGAMENKSLNIFNTHYVLADPTVVIDADFENIESVIGHEYFHNWSGNRVTCRDWFQLSLKEGFTVFREQQFSADMNSAAVKRIEDVAVLRDHQFQEDAGPLAHAVRPDSYIEINNFYTATVYNKGAEVIRMLRTLLGAKVFRRGCDLYFARHDGQAATTDDFVAAMADAADATGACAELFAQFKNWYTQAGTPVVTVESEFDAARKRLTLTFNQHCLPTPGQPHKEPFVIPIRAALFDRQGRRLDAREVDGEEFDDGADDAHGDADDNRKRDALLVLSKPRQSFVFENVDAQPVASLLRDFSAPVDLRYALSDADLAMLLAHDDDPFNRWEAGQKLFLKHILDGVSKIQVGENTESIEDSANIAISDSVLQSVDAVFNQAAADDDGDNDAALLAEILTLPSERYVSEQLEVIDPAAVFRARLILKHCLAAALKTKITATYHRFNRRNDGTVTPKQIAGRSLRDVCLGYLMTLDEDESNALAAAQLANAKCMTDAATALTALTHVGAPQKQQALDDFYAQWKDEPLAVDRWLRIQATAAREDTLATVQKLSEHPAFDRANPNKIYMLIIAFCHANPVCFHRADGAGYRFAAHWVAQLDPRNPQLAARLASAFTRWKKYTPELKTQLRDTLRDLAARPNLSNDVTEIVTKSLGEKESGKE